MGWPCMRPVLFRCAVVLRVVASKVVGILIVCWWRQRRGSMLPNNRWHHVGGQRVTGWPVNRSAQCCGAQLQPYFGSGLSNTSSSGCRRRTTRHASNAHSAPTAGGGRRLCRRLVLLLLLPSVVTRHRCRRRRRGRWVCRQEILPLPQRRRPARTLIVCCRFRHGWSCRRWRCRQIGVGRWHRWMTIAGGYAGGGGRNRALNALGQRSRGSGT